MRLLWYGLMLTAVLLAPLAVLLGQVLARDGLKLVPVTTTIGVLAAVVQFLGLSRWPFLVPALARTYEDPNSSAAAVRRPRSSSTPFTATSALPSGMLGYLFTGAWTLLIAVAMLQSTSFDDWLAWPGIMIGALLIVASLEFVGRFEEHGWKLAGTIVPIAYTAWSLWLLVAGIVLLAEARLRKAWPLTLDALRRACMNLAAVAARGLARSCLRGRTGRTSPAPPDSRAAQPGSVDVE